MPLNTAEGPSQEALEFVGQLVSIWSRSLPFRLIGRHSKRAALQATGMPDRSSCSHLPTRRHAVAI